MASPSSTKSDDRILINPKLVNEEAKSPVKLDDERLITTLMIEEQKLRNGDDWQLSKPRVKIQKVLPYLVEREEFAKYYSPKVLSVGPFHHGRGKNYKLMWAAMYLEGEGKGTKEAAEELLRKIKVNMDNLKGFYSYDAIEGVDDDELARIFFLDGCAVLHFMENASVEHPEILKINVDQLVVVHHDMLLLENQLPYQLLELICNDDETKLEGYINNFFKMHHMMPPDHKIKLPRWMKATEGGSKEAIITVDNPTHLLDFLRTAILKGRTHQGKGRQNVGDWVTFRKIQELKSAWIKVIEDKRRGSRLTDIYFTQRRFYRKGELLLSKLIVDDSTATTFLNLMAYEMCPDFEKCNEIRSYVAFLGSLIHHPDDVKILREAGVLLNLFDSDEEVVKLFNTIATDVVPNVDIYGSVRKQIWDHCNERIISRIAVVLTKLFHPTWSIPAFLASFLALGLAFVQTWVAVFPVNRTK